VDTIHTVTGSVAISQLGLTLVHEHLLIGYPGWWMDARAPRFVRTEVLARAVDKLAELRELGVRTLVDPCPMDLGRDVELMAEVASRSHVNIVCATGAYKEEHGISYTFGALPVEEIAAIYVQELTRGIGDTGICAGLVKVATGAPQISAYEQKLLQAGGLAAAQVGCPVLTHTDHASLGMEQLEALIAAGVPAHRIMVGHCDGRPDFPYHQGLADRGAYLGFDRFGLTFLQPDEVRMESVMQLVKAGYLRSLFLSHDAICGSWLGRPSFDGKEVILPAQLEQLQPDWQPTHLFKNILPKLRAQGLTREQERTLFVDNPARYFAGEEPPR
jgi:phosphotriesterase-related protein